MIKIEISNMKMFRNILKTLCKTVQGDLPFQFFEAGLRLGYMDKSHVRMISVQIQKEFFKEFTLEFEDEDQKELESQFFINTQDLEKVLAKLTKSDRLFLIRDSKGKQNNRLIIENMIGNRLQRVGLGLTEPDGGYDAIDGFYSSIAQIKTTIVDECLFDVEMITSELIEALELFTVSSSQVAEFTLKSTKLTLDSDSSLAEISDEVFYKTVYKSSQNHQKNYYSIDYLLNIVKDCATLGDNIKLNFNTDNPAVIVPIMEKDGNYIEVMYFLAPRVDEDEDWVEEGEETIE